MPFLNQGRDRARHEVLDRLFRTATALRAIPCRIFHAFNFSACTFLFYLVFILFGAVGCTHYHAIRDVSGPAEYAPQPGAPALVTRHAPLFRIHNPEQEHNRIGSPVATVDAGGVPSLHMDPEKPVIYYQVVPFSTASGRYTNVIYRVHFVATPLSIFPFFIGTGRNMGLLVILTFDARGEVILVTTAGTCGCYASVIPTNKLHPDALPETWTGHPVNIYGEVLPAMLNVTENSTLEIEIRPGEHRVMGVRMDTRKNLDSSRTIDTVLTPMEALRHLTLPDGVQETSLYYEAGMLAGHVKGAWKPWETLFLGFISMDAMVGMDKEYGNPNNPFYTSLNPWNRSASDLNDFPGFLYFYGWRL